MTKCYSLYKLSAIVYMHTIAYYFKGRERKEKIFQP